MTTIILPKTFGKHGYRLKCRFKIEPYPGQSRLDIEKVRVAERFVQDMHKQGWENDGRFDFVMKGPLPMVVPMTIHPRHNLTARQMYTGVARGQRFLDEGSAPAVSLVGSLNTSEYWEYEIAGVFVRTQIMTETPDSWEEERG